MISKTFPLRFRLLNILMQTGKRDRKFSDFKPIWREISTLNKMAVTLVLTMIENRLAQESGLYLLRFQSIAPELNFIF